MKQEAAHSLSTSTWVWVKIKTPGTSGFSPWFHLPGQPILGTRHVSLHKAKPHDYHGRGAGPGAIDVAARVAGGLTS